MSNQLSKVEPHAAALEAAADRMDADGIGGHPTRGHAAVLRDTVGCMRAEAAVGKTPYSYSDMHAGADDSEPTEENFRVTAARVEAASLLRRAGLEVAAVKGNKLNIADLDRCLSGQPIERRLRIKSLCRTAQWI
jgi:hypothetical protein